MPLSRATRTMLSATAPLPLAIALGAPCPASYCRATAFLRSGIDASRAGNGDRFRRHPGRGKRVAQRRNPLLQDRPIVTDFEMNIHLGAAHPESGGYRAKMGQLEFQSSCASRLGGFFTFRAGAR